MVDESPALAVRSKASPTAARVRNERVFRARDILSYALLTVLTLVATGWFADLWAERAEWSADTPVYAILTGFVVLTLTMPLARWFALPLMRRPHHMPASPGWKVGVATTFVPGGEDIEMLARTVRMLVGIDYPHETWVLDEGDDPDVRALCERKGAHHFTRSGIERYQRPSGTFEAGTKHGNYNAWLDAVAFDRYEIVSAFDPDHVPEPQFLTRVLGYFDDASVGYVQAPQFYYNQSASWIARGAAEETYAYYSSVQMCSYAIGFPIVTGCHNSHRVRALRQIGGFAAHEADDLLITIHYRASGWRGVYVPERLAAGITPVDMSGYLTQQRRWARSVVDVRIRAFPKLAKGLPVPERVFSFLHGLHYLYGVGSAINICLLSFMLATGDAPAVLSVATAKRLLVLFGVLQLCEFFRQRYFLQPERERGLHWRAGILRVAKWPHVLLALGDAAVRPRRGYALTPKVRLSRRIYSAAPAHVFVAALLTGAWAAGVARGVEHNYVVVAAAAAVVCFSLLAVSGELRSFPPPYDDRLATRELGHTQRA